MITELRLNEPPKFNNPELKADYEYLRALLAHHAATTECEKPQDPEEVQKIFDEAFHLVNKMLSDDEVIDQAEWNIVSNAVFEVFSFYQDICGFTDHMLRLTEEGAAVQKKIRDWIKSAKLKDTPPLPAVPFEFSDKVVANRYAKESYRLLSWKESFDCTMGLPDALLITKLDEALSAVDDIINDDDRIDTNEWAVYHKAREFVDYELGGVCGFVDHIKSQAVKEAKAYLESDKY